MADVTDPHGRAGTGTEPPGDPSSATGSDRGAPFGSYRRSVWPPRSSPARARGSPAPAFSRRSSSRLVTSCLRWA